jgi:hypothetical protein
MPIRPLPTAALVAIDGERCPFEIAASADRNDDIFLGDEILDVDLAFFIQNLGAALIAVLLLDLTELPDDDLAQLGITCQDSL